MSIIKYINGWKTWYRSRLVTEEGLVGIWSKDTNMSRIDNSPSGQSGPVQLILENNNKFFFNYYIEGTIGNFRGEWNRFNDIESYGNYFQLQLRPLKSDYNGIGYPQFDKLDDGCIFYNIDLLDYKKEDKTIIQIHLFNDSYNKFPGVNLGSLYLHKELHKNPIIYNKEYIKLKKTQDSFSGRLDKYKDQTIIDTIVNKEKEEGDSFFLLYCSICESQDHNTEDCPSNG